jgi:hypothetical protein
MKKSLKNFALILTSLAMSIGVSRAAGELAGIQYRNISVAGDGLSFSMEVWAYSVEPQYTTAALPWNSFIIRMDLVLEGGATGIGTMDATNVTYGLAKGATLTSTPPGGRDPKLGIYLTRSGGGELTETPQLLATVRVPVTGGTITSASVLETRSSPASPALTDTYWTSSVSETTFRSLIIPVDTPLPVTLTSFKVTKEGETVAQLTWTTTQESDASHFEIERSSDAKIWSQLGIVQSAQNSNALLNYNFTDVSPRNGNNYYRLKMVDLDGTFVNSRAESVMFGNAGNELVTVFPNPVSDVLYLRDSELTSLKEVALMSADGVTAYQSNMVSASGISVKNLSSGLYIVKVTRNDGSLSSHRVLINR